VNLNDFDYTLPTELIAQEPARKRDESRLMVLDMGSDTLHHGTFSDLPEYVDAGDLIVVNDTKVFPARLTGNKEDTGGEVEVFLLRRGNDGTWEALTRPARRVKKGTAVVFGDGLLRARIIEKGEGGRVIVDLRAEIPVHEAIDRIGKTPLPPYIKREPTVRDRERYQTIYAKERGSVAAPTAGLHFSETVFEKLRKKGVAVASVTLHVGIGTFRPLTEKDAEKNTLHSEYCIVPGTTAAFVRECRARGGRVFAVGTTTARALETASTGGTIAAYEGWTDLFIKPPYSFKTVDCMVTNFHLPRSSLLMMTCAFGGRERILSAYREAVRKRYRFYSYGDAMLILGKRSS